MGASSRTPGKSDSSASELTTRKMTNKTAATRYARALLDVAIKEKADLDRIERELVGVVESVRRSIPRSQRCCSIPSVPVPRKRAAVAELTARAELTPMVAS